MFPLVILLWTVFAPDQAPLKAHAQDLGLPVIPMAALSAIAPTWREGTELAVVLEKAEAVHWQEPPPEESEPIVDEPLLVHAFLAVDAKAVPLDPEAGMISCKTVRKERLHLKSKVHEISHLRKRMTQAVRKHSALVEAGKKSSAEALGKKIDLDVIRWNQLVEEIKLAATKEEEAQPDRLLDYRFELFGKKGRDLQANYTLAATLAPLRARYGQHIWYDYTPDLHRVVEGFLDEPYLTEGGIWRMRRALTAIRACTTNLSFSFEFATEWMNAMGERIPVVIRTHSWVYP